MVFLEKILDLKLLNKMRLVGGFLKGKRINNPLDKLTRPLKDLVRESIFNIITHSKDEYIDLKNAKVLDLFSGTGSFGIECISRGAKEVYFFENYEKSLKVLKKNIEILNLKKEANIFDKDIYKNNLDLKNIKFEIVFLDPPFKDSKINLLLKKIRDSGVVSKNTLIIIHRNKKTKEEFKNELNISREQIYGISKIIFGKIN